MWLRHCVALTSLFPALWKNVHFNPLVFLADCEIPYVDECGAQDKNRWNTHCRLSWLIVFTVAFYFVVRLNSCFSKCIFFFSCPQIELKLSLNTFCKLSRVSFMNSSCALEENEMKLSMRWKMQLAAGCDYCPSYRKFQLKVVFSLCF